MNIREAIIKVLIECGRDGLTSKAIALHVHGELNSFFNPTSLSDTIAAVRSYLYNQSRKDNAFIERIRGTQRFRICPKALIDPNQLSENLHFDKAQPAANDDNTTVSNDTSNTELTLF